MKNKFDVNANMNELAVLLAQKIKKYTVNDSSSVTVEKAQQLMNSILYCIDGYLNSFTEKEGKLISSDYTNVEALYQKGLEIEKENLLDTKNLFTHIQKTALDIDNISYQDTIFGGIDIFFQKYDVLYAAHETPGSIDYQLCLEVENLSGVEFILQYLKQLNIENEFCSKFAKKDILALLKGYDKDYKILLINIFEIVLTNVLALSMLKKDIFILTVDEKDIKSLNLMLDKLSIFELQEKLDDALKSICNILNIKNDIRLTYLQKAAKKISYNIQNGVNLQKLERVFIASDYSEDKKADEYNESISMSDDELRKIIEEIKTCRYTSDKLCIIQQNVHSLSDLVEILDNSIWTEEYDAVFRLLNEIEIGILFSIIKEDIDMGIEINALKNWQIELLRYIKISG